MFVNSSSSSAGLVGKPAQVLQGLMADLNLWHFSQRTEEAIVEVLDLLAVYHNLGCLCALLFSLFVLAGKEGPV